MLLVLVIEVLKIVMFIIKGCFIVMVVIVVVIMMVGMGYVFYVFCEVLVVYF